MNNLVAEKRRTGADVIALNIGEPDFDTPQHVKDAAVAALAQGKTKYTPGPGIHALREAIAAMEERENKIPCAARHVMVTPAKMAVFLSLQAMVEPGDDVLVPDPGWVSYAPMVRWAGGNPVPVPLRASTDFRMTGEAIANARTPKTRVVLCNSPSNPTGGVNSASDVKAMVDLAGDHDWWILSDEIYQRLQYDGNHISPASLPGAWERTATVNGLSKSFAMTGWRLGWVVAPPDLFAAVDKLQSQSLTHVTSFAQDAALAAVAGPQDSVAAMRKEFLRRRDAMVQGLRKLPGVTCAMPKGAFYAFPRFDSAQWGEDDALALDLLAKANVATTAGSAFGAAGRNHLRLSYATSLERIHQALERMAAYAAT